MLDLLKETNKTRRRPTEPPIEQNNRLREAHRDTVMDRGMYERLIGRLIFLLHTRSDIIYVVNIVSQFMHNPKEIFKQCVKFYNT